MGNLLRYAAIGAAAISLQLAAQDPEDLYAALAPSTVTVVTDNARPAIPISTEAVRVGQRIYVIGTPQGLPATFSDGLVSSVRTGEGVSRIQITAPISPGSSGGPVLNAKGQLVGVAVEQFREGQNLNFAIPAADLSGLLKLRTPPKKPAAPPVVRSEKPAAPPSSLERSITSWGKCRILALSDRAGAVAVSSDDRVVWSDKVPAALKKYLQQQGSAAQRIDDIVLRDNGSWLVVQGGGIVGSGMPADLVERLQERARAGSQFRSITVNNNGDWIVVSRTGFMASDTRLIEYLQSGMEQYGMPYSAHLTDNGLVICYERGYTMLGTVPPELKAAVKRTSVNAFRVTFVDSGAWFLSDDEGTFAMDLDGR
ncbi:MAG TPA: serine protease [Flavobacteriales bacterium]|nr:serine protease [Flavobacteriales bacterium]